MEENDKDILHRFFCFHHKVAFTPSQRHFVKLFFQIYSGNKFVFTSSWARYSGKTFILRHLTEFLLKEDPGVTIYYQAPTLRRMRLFVKGIHDPRLKYIAPTTKPSPEAKLNFVLIEEPCGDPTNKFVDFLQKKNCKFVVLCSTEDCPSYGRRVDPDAIKSLEQWRQFSSIHKSYVNSPQPPTPDERDAILNIYNS